MRTLKTEREVLAFVDSLSPAVAAELYEALRDNPNLGTRGILLTYRELCRRRPKKNKKTEKLRPLTREEFLLL